MIVFDRGVETDCAVTFINPIGGYGYGAVAADFLVGKVKPEGKILALRISPGVDVLETRWSAAKLAFDKSGLDVVDVKFTDGDPAKTKAIVTDALTRNGDIDGVWMDSGATSVAAVEAFEDAGRDAAHHRRGPAGLPPGMEGEEAHRDRALLPHLPVAHPGHRRAEDPQGAAGPEGVEAAAAHRHPGDPRPVLQARHAATALRDVRLREPPGFPEKWGGKK